MASSSKGTPARSVSRGSSVFEGSAGQAQDQLRRFGLHPLAAAILGVAGTLLVALVTPFYQIYASTPRVKGWVTAVAHGFTTATQGREPMYTTIVSLGNVGQRPVQLVDFGFKVRYADGTSEVMLPNYAYRDSAYLGFSDSSEIVVPMVGAGLMGRVREVIEPGHALIGVMQFRSLSTRSDRTLEFVELIAYDCFGGSHSIKTPLGRLGGVEKFYWLVPGTRFKRIGS